MVREEKFTWNLRDNFFILRVLGLWNKLPEKVVEASVITTLKRYLNK